MGKSGESLVYLITVYVPELQAVSLLQDSPQLFSPTSDAKILSSEDATWVILSLYSNLQVEICDLPVSSKATVWKPTVQDNPKHQAPSKHHTTGLHPSSHLHPFL